MFEQPVDGMNEQGGEEKKSIFAQPMESSPQVVGPSLMDRVEAGVKDFANQTTNASVGLVDALGTLGSGLVTWPAQFAAGLAGHLSGQTPETVQNWQQQMSPIQAGQITNALRGTVGLEPVNPAESAVSNYLNPITKAQEFLIPGEKIEKNLSQVKELGVNPTVANTFAYLTRNFIELMALHGAAELSKGAIGGIKKGLKAYENKLKAGQPTVNEESDLIGKMNQAIAQGDYSPEALGQLENLKNQIEADRQESLAQHAQNAISTVEEKLAALREGTTQRVSAEAQQAASNQRDLQQRLERGIPPEEVVPEPIVEQVPSTNDVSAKLEQMRQEAKARIAAEKAEREQLQMETPDEIQARQTQEAQRTNQISQDAVEQQKNLQRQLDNVGNVGKELSPAEQKLLDMRNRIEAARAKGQQGVVGRLEKQADRLSEQVTMEGGEASGLQEKGKTERQIVSGSESVPVQEDHYVQEMNTPKEEVSYKSLTDAQMDYDVDLRKFKSSQEAQDYIDKVPQRVKDEHQLEVIKVGRNYRVGEKIPVDQTEVKINEAVKDIQRAEDGLDVPFEKPENPMSPEEIRAGVVDMIPEIQRALETGQEIEDVHSRLQELGNHALSQTELELSDKIDQTLSDLWKKKLEIDQQEMQALWKQHSEDLKAKNLRNEDGTIIKVDKDGYNGISIEDFKNILSAINKKMGEEGAIGNLGQKVSKLSQAEIDSVRNAVEMAKRLKQDLVEYLKTAGLGSADAKRIKEIADRLGEGEQPRRSDFKVDSSNVENARGQIQSITDEMKNDKGTFGKFLEEKYKTRELVKTYENGDGQYERQLSGITNEAPQLREGSKMGSKIGSPHNVLDMFMRGDNPVTDVMKSAMTFVRNVYNGTRWRKDLLRNIPKLSEAAKIELEPIFQKYQKRYELRSEIGKVVDDLERRMNKLAVDSSQYKRLEKQLKEEKAKFKEVSVMDKEMKADFDAIINNPDSLLTKESSSRVVLQASGLLPKDAVLTPEELRVATEVRKFFDNTREDMKSQGMKVQQGDYVSAVNWKAIVNPDTLESGFFRSTTKAPKMLEMMGKMPDGRPWMPDIHSILEAYIPIIERELAYNPFLDRWSSFINAYGPPEVRSYMKNWINENLYRKPETFASNLLSAATAFEFLNILSLSVPTAFKHLTKVFGTLSKNSTLENIKAIGGTVKAAGNLVGNRLGVMKEGNELRLIRSYVTAKDIVHSLDETPIRSALDNVKGILASPVTAIEWFDNGVSILSGIARGSSKNIGPTMTERGLIRTMLDVNFRGGWDMPMWMKHSGYRTFSMFQTTPFKSTEMKYQMVKRAVSNERDAFGTRYGSQLVKYVLMIGAAESLARANDTSMLDMFLHIPFVGKWMEGTRKGYKLQFPNLTGSPFVDVAHDAMHNREGVKGAIRDTLKLDRNFMPTEKSSPAMNRWIQIMQGKKGKYDSISKELLGLKPLASH